MDGASLLMGACEALMAGLLLLFAILRAVELSDLYLASSHHLLLHLLACALLTRLTRPKRLLGAAVLYGVMRHAIDARPLAIPDELTLVGTNVVLVGASSGIGLALAAQLARLEATVVLGCRDVAKCERVRPQSPRVRCLSLNLSDLSAVKPFAEAVGRHVDRVDYLVLNAGFLGTHGARTAQGIELSFGVMHLSHFLLTRELWHLIQRPHPTGLPARVVSHASAAFMVGEFKSLLVGDGMGDVHGEVVDGCLTWENSFRDWVVGGARSMANLYFNTPLVAGFPTLCPIAGAYSRAKLAQVLFSQELQHRVDESALRGSGFVREVRSIALHPGTVRSAIVPLPDWLVRPTDVGAHGLMYCLLGDVPGGSYVDEMRRVHNLLNSTSGGTDAQSGRPDGYFYSLPIFMYMRVTEGVPARYRAALWEISETLSAPYASSKRWP